MPVKTNAKVTVNSDQLVTDTLGFKKVNAKGTVDVELPPDVAKQFADEGAVTVTTAAVDL